MSSSEDISAVAAVLGKKNGMQEQEHSVAVWTNAACNHEGLHHSSLHLTLNTSYMQPLDKDIIPCVKHTYQKH